MNNRGVKIDENIFLLPRKNARSKRVRISVVDKKNVLVTFPKHYGQRKAIQFALDNLDWIRKKLGELEEAPPKMLATASRQEYLMYKEKARLLVQRRMGELNGVYDFEFGRIAIRNQKSRWGSCSSNGNLNFSYKIIFLPQRLQDYLIVHELCHLKEMNHSQKFWQLVSRTFPDYRKLSREIRSL